MDRITVLLIIIITSLISACATTSQPKTSEISIGNPGDYKFSEPHVNVMYDLMVAELAAQRGMSELAVKYYLSAARASRDPEVAERAVRIANVANHKQEAMEAARIWVEAEPDNIDASRMLAFLYLNNGQYEKAKEELKTILAAGPDKRARTFLFLSTLMHREVPPEPSYEVILYLTDLYPDLPEAQYVAASLALRANKVTQAMDHIKLALGLKREWSEAVVLRARIVQMQDGVDAALEYLHNYLKVYPQKDDVRLTYARALVEARRLKDARSQFEVLAVKMPDNEDVLFALAMLSMQFQQLEEAEGYLSQLVDLGKRTPQIAFYLGQISERKKRDDVAMEWYSSILSGEYLFDAQLRIGAIIARMSSIEEAQKHLSQVKANSIDDQRELILFEGQLLRDQKKYKQVFELYGNALNKKAFKNDNDILYERALIAEHIGKVDLAIKDLELVVKQQPENAAALNALGYTLADRTKRFDEAYAYVKKAMDLEPDDPAIMDSMGWVHYRRGEHDEALKYLAKAMEILQDGEVAAHYGEVLWSMGQQDKAREVWDKALKDFGDNDVLRETLERYK
ncbi:MAG: tetratricopeptide repeat protein [Gammaproteobacteria bacterium]|nr:tetratricopeptide repeat protein [Gammaproteobacteria bacterium]MDH5727428.1 tetratricopeptide repeat protein [Gammaproteobacteria bacterium]